MKYRTALHSVRGLGSARSGTQHWWMQRVTAVALTPLMIWFGISVARVSAMGYQGALAWLGSPVNAVLMLCCLLALFYHAKLGMQVVIEDYVHREGVKIASLLALNFLTLLFGLASILAVLRVHFSG